MPVLCKSVVAVEAPVAPLREYIVACRSNDDSEMHAENHRAFACAPATSGVFNRLYFDAWSHGYLLPSIGVQRLPLSTERSAGSVRSAVISKLDVVVGTLLLKDLFGHEDHIDLRSGLRLIHLRCPSEVRSGRERVISTTQ